jgi:membrane associated rhomboid family serine protease
MTHPLRNDPSQVRSRHPLEAPDPHEIEAAEMQAARDQGRILPLKFVNAPQRPYLTYALIVVNALVFLVRYLDPTLAAHLLLGGWLDPYGVVKEGEWWRLVTLMFLHANVQHVLMNNLALYTIGSSVETTYGRTRFLLVYFLGGLLGSVLQLLLGGDGPAVGASGAVFALVGAEIVHLRLHRDFYLMGQRRLQQLLVMAGLNLAVGLFSVQIANWAHIGGFIGGALLAWRISPRFSVETENLPDKPEALPAIDTHPMQKQRWLEMGAYTVGLIVLCGVALLVLSP